MAQYLRARGKKCRGRGTMNEGISGHVTMAMHFHWKGCSGMSNQSAKRPGGANWQTVSTSCDLLVQYCCDCTCIRRLEGLTVIRNTISSLFISLSHFVESVGCDVESMSTYKVVVHFAANKPRRHMTCPNVIHLASTQLLRTSTKPAMRS